jgi:hypothetical protein
MRSPSQIPIGKDHGLSKKLPLGALNDTAVDIFELASPGCVQEATDLLGERQGRTVRSRDGWAGKSDGLLNGYHF